MEKRSYAEVEKQLLSHLSAANLSKDHLADVSKSIAASYKSGLQIVDWWIYGIPAFERIVIQAQVPIAETTVIQSLLGNAVFKGIDILRKGIPKPDYFQVNLTVEKIAE
ncbi:MAG TPA: hypothetical protein VGN00_29470 [Puia sp.]|jgi:hypothetical protein